MGSQRAHRRTASSRLVAAAAVGRVLSGNSTPENAVFRHIRPQRSPFAAQMRGKTAFGGRRTLVRAMNFEAFDE